MNLLEAASQYAGPKMFFFFFFFFLLQLKSTSSIEANCTFNGFSGVILTLDGLSSITSNGLLELTNMTLQMSGHAFHPVPLRFKSQPAKTRSFSTTFVFAIQSELSYDSGHGVAFVISSTNNISTATPYSYLGLFNIKENGNSTKHVFAVELDTILNPELQDIDGNHVGIDINSVTSYMSHTAGYYNDNTDSFQNLTRWSGQPMQVWIDFNGEEMQLNVTLSPMRMPKPVRPLLSSVVDLSTVLHESMYVGFSASTGSLYSSHYILRWSFTMNSAVEDLNYAKLPKLPRIKAKSNLNVMTIWLPIVAFLFLFSVVAVIILVVRRRRMKYAELLEDWESEYGPHRFSYKDLFHATEGFKEKRLLGTGGFGRVYRGVLPSSMIEVAVKKVSHESRQGMKEFVAEIVSIGQLRHRNIVQLLGYCRRKGELLLVYDFMPNSSLDKFLYERDYPTLSWAARFRIIRGVASGLLYLHEEWEQVVVHRDIKASNVLLDGELNGRLGDFGLARLYDHGTDPQTTHVVGTMGYIAPELARNCKATTITDVFAFGAFLLEVVCGRRPVEPHAEAEELVLVDVVLENWKKGLLIDTVDPKLRDEHCPSEVELVLKLGVVCSHPLPAARPSMRQVMQILDGDADLPELSPNILSNSSMSFPHDGFENWIVSFPLYSSDLASTSSVRTPSLLSGGR